MIKQSRYKGTMSFDALFSIVPIILIFVFLMDVMSFVGKTTEEASRSQDVFDRLVSIADYSVKTGIVKKDGKVSYPNWIEENMAPASYVENLRTKAGLSELYISLDEPDGYDICIYRIVVVGEQKKIARLFVCGG